MLWHHWELELPAAVQEVLGGGPKAGWTVVCTWWSPLTNVEYLGGLVLGGEQKPPQGQEAPAGSGIWREGF